MINAFNQQSFFINLTGFAASLLPLLEVRASI
jgi:hypothetical protein